MIQQKVNILNKALIFGQCVQINIVDILKVFTLIDALHFFDSVCVHVDMVDMLKAK